MPFQPQQLNLPPPGPGPLLQVRGRPTGVTDILHGGVSVGVASVTATLVRDRALTANATGTASVSSTLVRLRARTAATTGVASVSATLVRGRVFAPGPHGTATVTATVGRNRALVPAAAGTATVSASVSNAIVLITASSTGTATVSGDLVPPIAPGPFIGAGGLTTYISYNYPTGQPRPLTATSTGHAAVGCQLVIEQTMPLGAITTGHSTVTSSLTIDPFQQIHARSAGDTMVGCDLTKTDLLDRELEQLLALELIPA